MSQQFQVPQFIDIEDKIIGPLTLKQFGYLAIAGAFSFVLFFVLVTWLWIVITVLLTGMAAGLAFIKYNGRPLLVMLGAMGKYFWQPKFYLWKSKPATVAGADIKFGPLPKQGISKNPLKNLLLRMSTSKSSIAGREKKSPEATQAALKGEGLRTT
ncbi:MAG: hypothetical protein COU11_03360 [Candidatus Harrisonbacteria bacterium CG10_big_fil_rev_8_21_14_0_10_49_15]|uniref:PrgI family protein n=1 Tax=Candidatus Harrisonbacteria bacterium CG10_big_fil_rev_8_21_14_0_10_49_15 TaxID=1974587 RepID=A0A2H0UM63_9BACT|nr:MAG: hypothetical protein COU11_03360 [Candidatus Harrisonbacteria bacterium CG10_big_fil_rev_8_21_14_0_10_49_15]